ncbi:uncharacterized protein EV422DRAFT_396951 [Fimicolochytrium jonesii]|uniref:uncharacterized protein n=1 Tax=Fimicolochytrium jonesii TaxID=1396493 RepID=UPI0022FF449B|nr:uncharacterized protein EV422DRAFT_396951 [Fimicolochytrium jonesii]KAI8822395.1 hypothetical protein EV422DRAFT_396951 [Fimicolochytrium jonesii]
MWTLGFSKQSELNTKPSLIRRLTLDKGKPRTPTTTTSERRASLSSVTSQLRPVHMSPSKLATTCSARQLNSAWPVKAPPTTPPSHNLKIDYASLPPRTSSATGSVQVTASDDHEARLSDVKPLSVSPNNGHTSSPSRRGRSIRDTKAKTAAKRRSRSLTTSTANWKIDSIAEVVEEPTKPVEVMRRSRSHSPVRIDEKQHFGAKTVAKKRESRFVSKRASAGPVLVCAANLSSRNFRSRVHPSSALSIQGRTSSLVDDLLAEDQREEELVRRETPSPIPSVDDSVRLRQSLEQQIYLSAYAKLQDTKRSPSSRMALANLMLYIQSIQPGVELLEIPSDGSTSATWAQAANYTTSAPWTNKEDGDIAMIQAPLPNPTAFGKKPTSQFVRARRSNRKRLAKLAAGISLSPGASPLRYELGDESNVSTLLRPSPEPPRAPSRLSASTSRSCLMSEDVGGFQIYEASTNASEFSVATSISGKQKKKKTGIKKVLHFFKSTFLIEDPVQRARRREAAFYNPGAARTSMPEIVVVPPKSISKYDLSTGTVDVGFRKRSMGQLRA